MTTWKDKLDKALEGLDSEISAYVKKSVEEEVTHIVSDISFYPLSEKPGMVVMWAAEAEHGKVNLKKRFKEWFDDPDRGYMATKRQLEAWAHFDDMAEMIRGLIANGKYKGGPKDNSG